MFPHQEAISQEVGMNDNVVMDIRNDPRFKISSDKHEANKIRIENKYVRLHALQEVEKGVYESIKESIDKVEKDVSVMVGVINAYDNQQIVKARQKSLERDKIVLDKLFHGIKNNGYNLLENEQSLVTYEGVKNTELYVNMLNEAVFVPQVKSKKKIAPIGEM
jgi:hypothetical protein